MAGPFSASRGQQEEGVLLKMGGPETAVPPGQQSQEPMSWERQRVATPLCTLDAKSGFSGDRVAEHPRPGIAISTLILRCLIPLLPLQSEQLRLEGMGEEERQ